MIEWVLGQAEAKEPELPNAWPWKDTPSFVPLRNCSANSQAKYGGGEKAWSLLFGKYGSRRRLI